MGVSHEKLKALLEKTARATLVMDCPIGRYTCRANMEEVKATLGQQVSTCACCYADWLMENSKED
jgi:hypothetical protein